jgi:hypothetical protein
MSDMLTQFFQDHHQTKTAVSTFQNTKELMDLLNKNQNRATQLLELYELTKEDIELLGN